jgi:hypothetical protein
MLQALPDSQIERSCEISLALLSIDFGLAALRNAFSSGFG